MMERARSVKFGLIKKQALLEALRRGVRRGAAATEVGIHYETMRNHYKNDPEFAAQVDQAEMDANEAVEDALYQAALSGNVVAAQVWLYNRMPDRWRDQRHVAVTNTDAIRREAERLAREQGLDVDEVLREAEQIVGAT